MPGHWFVGLGESKKEPQPSSSAVERFHSRVDVACATQSHRLESKGKKEEYVPRDLSISPDKSHFGIYRRAFRWNRTDQDGE